MTDDEKKQEIGDAVEYVVTYNDLPAVAYVFEPNKDEYRREWVRDHADEEWLDAFLGLMRDQLPRLSPKQSADDLWRIDECGEFLGEWLSLRAVAYLPKALPLLHDPRFRGFALRGLAWGHPEDADPALADRIVPALLPLEADTSDFYENEWENWIEALGDTNDPKALAVLRRIRVPTAMEEAQHYVKLYINAEYGLLFMMPRIEAWWAKTGTVSKNYLFWFRRHLNAEWLDAIRALLSNLPGDVRNDPARRQVWLDCIAAVLADWITLRPGLVLDRIGPRIIMVP